MKVYRIVANIQTADVAKAEAFYHDVLGMDPKPFEDVGCPRTSAAHPARERRTAPRTPGGSAGAACAALGARVGASR